MKKQILAIVAIPFALAVSNRAALAQQSTPAPTEAEKEAFYAASIENRVGDMLKGG